MAAFSEQHPTFVLDSFVVPNASKNMSSFTEATTITTETCFSSMPPNYEYLQEIPLHAQIHETSSPHKSYSIKVPLLSCHSTTNTTDPSFTVKQDSVSSITAVENQVTQVVSPMKKRKSMEMKVERDAKGEKERQYSRNPRNSKKKMKKVPDGPPTDYVHVRARRGQATDSHSLAERVRRHKISLRMKLLQSLVPGCDKITGKALILEEIIKYVQTLQSQVEYLAAKLSSVSPIFDDFEVDFNTKTFAQEKTYSLDFQLPPVVESSSTQLTSFPDQKTTAPNSQLLLHQEQRSNLSFHDDGNMLWGTDISQRHGLTDNYGLDSWSSF